MPVWVRMNRGSRNTSRKRTRAALIAGCDNPMRCPARVTARSVMSASKAFSRLRSTALRSIGCPCSLPGTPMRTEYRPCRSGALICARNLRIWYAADERTVCSRKKNNYTDRSAANARAATDSILDAHRRHELPPILAWPTIRDFSHHYRTAKAASDPGHGGMPQPGAGELGKRIAYGGGNYWRGHLPYTGGFRSA